MATITACGLGVIVGVSVGVFVGVDVGVWDGVDVGVSVGVGVGDNVGEGVKVGIAVLAATRSGARIVGSIIVCSLSLLRIRVGNNKSATMVTRASAIAPPAAIQKTGCCVRDVLLLSAIKCSA